MTPALEFYSGKHVLLTGGAGYLATNLVEQLRGVTCRITRVDLPGSAYASPDGSPEVRNIDGDLRQPATWEKLLEGVDVVFHLAAQTSTYVANDDPASDLEGNVLPMVHLLEACRRNAWRPTVLFSSTVTVCGIPSRLPVDETPPDDPRTVYDLHKMMAERYLKYYVRNDFLRGAILRLANVYGPGPRSSRPDRGILNLMVRRAMAGEALTVYRPGTQLRDYVYVEDVVRAFLLAPVHIDLLNGRHFVIGSGEGHSILGAFRLVAERVALKTGRLVEVDLADPPSPQSPIESRDFVADTGRFSALTGWRAAHRLPEGIDRTVEVLS